MAAPLYFLPRVGRAQLIPAGKVNRSLLSERGLADVWSDVISGDDIATNEISGSGPGEQPGILAVALPNDRSLPTVVSYKPDSQKWQPAGDGSLLWIGIDDAQPPSSADIARRRQHQGYPVELADGNEWTVPIIRRPPGIVERFGVHSTELPCEMIRDKNGVLQFPLKPEFQSLWESTLEVCNHFFDSEGVIVDPINIDREWGMDRDITFLGVNYRFGQAEQIVLGLIDTENYYVPLGMAIDTPLVITLIREWNESKKKTNGRLAADGVSSTNGELVETPDTAPAGANCT